LVYFVALHLYKKNMNTIGIDLEQSKRLSEKLNVLLANYQLYYQNLRGFHWNVTGTQFFELHAKFEELYTTANLAVDEIAERILTLGATPLHTFQEYLDASSIKAAKNKRTGKDCVTETVNNLSVLLAQERKLLKMAADADDEGTVTLMSDYINTKEKTIWMLTAYLK
jgi:starvation-inducible DNA-binding protein